MTLGEKVYQLRSGKNMTQDELALAVGYKSRSTIAKIESGEREPGQSMVVALANALDVTPAYLMGWEGADGTLIQKRGAIIKGINDLSEERIDKLLGYLDGLRDK